MSDTAQEPSSLDVLIAERAALIGGEFETRRVAAVQKMNKYRVRALIAGVGVFGVAFVASLISTDVTIMAAIFAGVVATVIGFSIAQQPGSKYKRSVKNEAFPRFVATFGREFRYRQRGNLPMDFLRRSSLLPGHDERSFEDYISGSWAGVAFALHEAKLVDIRGTDKNKRRVTVFDGLFAVFDLPKDITGRIIIRRDMGAIGNWFGDAFSRLDRVTLEDPTFEKEFEVFGEDQVEARTVLTTTFMERLRLLAEDIGEGRLQGAFYEGKFLAMIPCRRNRFEPSLTLEPGATRRDLERFAIELKDVMQIAERLRFGDPAKI